MDRFIESELHNAIFHDSQFVDRFLSEDVTKLDQVYEKRRSLDSHYDEKGQWKLPSIIKTEKSLYDPMLKYSTRSSQPSTLLILPHVPAPCLEITSQMSHTVAIHPPLTTIYWVTLSRNSRSLSTPPHTP
ncbi:hypothetical protein ACGC1H_006462 [Rhizoctonia solani]